MVDRTDEWVQSVHAACSVLGLSPEGLRKQTQSLILKPKRERSQFATVAEGVRQSIDDLSEFIAANKRDYLSTGKLTEQGKDKVEEQVGQAVRAITQHLDALKEGVVAAQQPADGTQALINEHSAAHLHGAVLVLVEQLHSVTAGFDKCRAVRYQQSLAKELRQHRKVPQSVLLDHQKAAWQERDSSDGGGSDAAGNSSMQQMQQQDPTRRLLVGGVAAGGAEQCARCSVDACDVWSQVAAGHCCFIAVHCR
eukprot:GHRQ01015353.1.p1 GENE.GHRQ01015353.1~~GHRQ01015353.1.p1  ORF type:complete len:252 (+),score=89.33 GHRQ01015353.1:227-982(+)